MKRILVLCTGNSCRSQMMHGFLADRLRDQAAVFSAGVEVHGVNPNAIKTMAEDGIDISRHTSNNIDEYTGLHFDYVITVCDNAKERCPVFPSNSTQLHFNFPDPAGFEGSEEETRQEFARVRDMIKKYVEGFVKEHLSTQSSS